MPTGVYKRGIYQRKKPAPSEKVLMCRDKLILDIEFEWMREMVSFSGAGSDLRPVIYIHRRQSYYIAHLVLNKKQGFIVDHINGNPLDNRMENLRYLTLSQNSFNKRRSPFEKGPMRGVQVKGKKFMAVSNDKSLGCYDTKEEAFSVYISEQKRIHGAEFVESCMANITQTKEVDASRSKQRIK